jgi:diketogulonate reductase-like aldo/keto reductase
MLLERHELKCRQEMEAVREAGLARSIGVSNFSTAQLRRLFAVAKVPPAVNQVRGGAV